MSNAAVVLAVRGARHKVTEADEGFLEEVFNFLEGLRALQPPKPAVRERRVLTLPECIQDWYVPRGVGRPQYFLEGDEDEKKLHKFVAMLHKKGIPSFLREGPKVQHMKLFVSLQATLRDEAVPVDAGARSTFWVSLKQSFVHFVLTEMAGVVLELFGPSAASNLVAVFDATGHSPAAGRWKLSFRACFAEVAVTQETARRARSLLIKRLERAWVAESQEAWAATLEGVGSSTGSKPTPEAHQGGAGPDASAPPPAGSPGFWQGVVDESAFLDGAQHRLVWCDVAQGSPPFPEQRPLLPYELFQVKVQAGIRPELERLGVTQSLDDCEWARLGSTWTAMPLTPLPIVSSSGCRVKPARAHGRSSVQAAGDRKNSVLADGWEVYHTGAGRPYYHKPSTGETVWELPAPAAPAERMWRVYYTGEGRAYYHNTATKETCWELPPGAQLLSDVVNGGAVNGGG